MEQKIRSSESRVRSASPLSLALSLKLWRNREDLNQNRVAEPARTCSLARARTGRKKLACTIQEDTIWSSSHLFTIL